MVLDARTSDAIAIAMRTKTPIWTTRAILSETGFIMEVKDASEELPSDSEIARAIAPDSAAADDASVEELEKRLARHIENEEYEEAARVQSLINSKREKL